MTVAVSPAFSTAATCLLEQAPVLSCPSTEADTPGRIVTSSTRLLVRAGLRPVALAVLDFAYQELGAAYSMARRMGPRSFDCSSFVFRAYLRIGIRLPEVTDGWLAEDSPARRFEIDRNRLRPGDVILVPREAINKYLAGVGNRSTDYNHALIVARVDGSGRATWVIDASGRLGVSLRRTPRYVFHAGTRFFRPRH